MAARFVTTASSAEGSSPVLIRQAAGRRQSTEQGHPMGDDLACSVVRLCFGME
jgi:hypothetical protein